MFQGEEVPVELNIVPNTFGKNSKTAATTFFRFPWNYIFTFWIVCMCRTRKRGQTGFWGILSGRTAKCGTAHLIERQLLRFVLPQPSLCQLPIPHKIWLVVLLTNNRIVFAISLQCIICTIHWNWVKYTYMKILWVWKVIWSGNFCISQAKCHFQAVEIQFMRYIWYWHACTHLVSTFKKLTREKS